MDAISIPSAATSSSALAGLDPEEFAGDGMVLALGDGTVALGVGLAERCATPPERGAAFYAPDFYLRDPRPWWIPRVYREVSARELGSLLADHAAPPPRIAWQTSDGAGFRAWVDDVLEQVRAGTIDKAVPVDVMEGELTGAPRPLPPRSTGPHLQGALLGVLVRALAASRGARAYGAWAAGAEECEGLVGVTPELLFSYDGASLRTVALAGTRRASSASAVEAMGADLLADEKERREHQLVIDDIRQQLVQFGAVEISRTRILEFPGLLHLETQLDLHAHRGPLSFEALIAALHPTAALGTFPRRNAFAVLRRRDDPARRGRLGAPFGIRRPDGSGLCVVAIRNLQWIGRRVRLGAGCGVVAGSTADREWLELSAKRAAVRAMLGL